MLIKSFLRMNRSSTQNVNILILEGKVCPSASLFFKYFFICFEKLLSSISIIAYNNIFSSETVSASCLSKLGSNKGSIGKIKSALISIRRGQNLILYNSQTVCSRQVEEMENTFYLESTPGNILLFFLYIRIITLKNKSVSLYRW